MISQLERYFGGGAVLAPTAKIRHDGPRVLDVTPSGAGTSVTLPDARLLRPGWHTFILLNSSVTNFVTVYKNDGVTSIGAVGTTEALELNLLDSSTANGDWAALELTSSIKKGSALASRFPMDVTLDSDGGTIQLVTACRQRFPNWDVTTPAAVRLTIASGVTRFSWGPGGTTPLVPAIYSGFFAAGSTLLIVNHGVVTGYGGLGGNGGYPSPGLLSTPGSAGGPAMILLLPTTIVNHGTVQGGGGGGGGGAASGVYGGGGGGGGAGHVPGLGGFGGGGGSSNGSTGQRDRGGSGGSASGAGQAGGAGGFPGSAGAAGGGGSGAAGARIHYWSSGGVTVTWLRAGTRYGSDTTF